LFLNPNPESMSPSLPGHFLTIVLNGEPFIRHHIEVFPRLPFSWHWHIVEGVADLKHDTAWSLKLGGRITDQLHRNGLSNDGTSAYLDQLARESPENVTIYRKPPGDFWDGKLEMVNAALANIRTECLLWQIDSDELWTTEQICAAHAMFGKRPERTAAFYLCHYLVGENLLITSRDTYGNHTDFEWLRTWRFKPGMRWMAHEPPRLGQLAADGQWSDIASTKPFRHADTEPLGLVFQHFAYAIEKQLQFKELYYGYKDAVKHWRELQQQTTFPVLLRKFFPWVKDGAAVDTVESQNLALLARKNILGQWRFRAQAPPADEPQRILWIRIDAIGDSVLAASMLPHLRRKYSFAEITVLCLDHVAELYESCPFIDRIIPLERRRIQRDKRYRKKIAAELQAKRFDLALNSTYSRTDVADILAKLCGARERIAFEGDCSNLNPQLAAQGKKVYERLISTGPEPKPELDRHRDFLQGIGISADELNPIVWTTQDDESWAEATFKKHRLDRERTFALFPSAQESYKDYPHFGEVLRQFPNYDVVVFGKTGTPIVQELLSKVPNRLVNLIGQTTLRQLASCMRRCRLYIGVDSAGAHLACAVGLPNVVVMGGGHFGRFLPYSPLTSIVSLPLDCFGCNWQCRFSKVHCLCDIPPEVVVTGVRKTLESSSARPRIFFPRYPSDWQPKPGEPALTAITRLIDSAQAELCPVEVSPQLRLEQPAGRQTQSFFGRLRSWIAGQQDCGKR